MRASPLLPMISAGVVAASLLVGCGSSAKVEAQSVSVGQQLQDLDKARDQGLLTESEYQSQRRKILEGK